MHPGDRFLQAFHRAHPGVTTRALQGGRTERGGSSYDALAAIPGRGDRVLDLGCGDGYLLELLVRRGLRPHQLAGVDQSAAEIARARAREALAGAALIAERAQELSRPDGSADSVLSHLAFPLMSDAPRVAAEIARVLAPGGTFAAIVGGGPKLGDAFELFLDLFQPIYEAQPERAPRLGDRRARTAEGLRELFGPVGLGEVAVEELPLRLDGSLDRVWRTLATSYELFVLGDADRARLERRFREAAGPLTRPDGTVPCTMSLHRALCRRPRPGPAR